MNENEMKRNYEGITEIAQKYGFNPAKEAPGFYRHPASNVVVDLTTSAETEWAVAKNIINQLNKKLIIMGLP